ncbi:hypothetical protein SDC9_160780 [bioreactor metagenome]|uniref:Uncharacterized protein n=1 Tax=bioreactor metagenome TaxID=1076179 RepID=A0A645FJE6_9ZZZZ
MLIEELDCFEGLIRADFQDRSVDGGFLQLFGSIHGQNIAIIQKTDGIAMLGFIHVVSGHQYCNSGL